MTTGICSLGSSRPKYLHYYRGSDFEHHIEHHYVRLKTNSFLTAGVRNLKTICPHSASDNIFETFVKYSHLCTYPVTLESLSNVSFWKKKFIRTARVLLHVPPELFYFMNVSPKGLCHSGFFNANNMVSAVPYIFRVIIIRFSFWKRL